MSEHYATVIWQRAIEETFVDNKYSRAHQWSFDGGAIIQGSASPLVVPPPYSLEQNVDPEEAFIASVSSCHMLFFLSFTARKKCVVNRYRDEAIGTMKKNKSGRFFIDTITLRPQIEFHHDTPITAKAIEDIHHQSHEHCFIANSINTAIRIE